LAGTLFVGAVTVPRPELAATALAPRAAEPVGAASGATLSELVTGTRLRDVLGDKEFLSDVSCHDRPGLEPLESRSAAMWR
jgi:hypothetical protein